MMRVVFMGTPGFAVASLRAILDAGYEVPLVVTTPDREKGRGLKSTPSDVKRFALERGLEVATPEKLKDPELADLVRSKQPDVICVVAFRILPESLYSIPPLGSFNLHASLLPKYRGAAPINWALINGETESGVTTFLLQRQVDTGSILLQRPVPVGPDMTAGELHDVLKEVGAEAVVETLRMIESGTATPLPQNDAEATPAPKIFRDDCRIDWTKPARRVHDFVRGLSPYPAAFTRRRDRSVKILRTRVADDAASGEPGLLASDGRILTVGCGRGRLEVLELQPEGKRAMMAEEFLRGNTIHEGETLT
jgi:methionyl-tRNA formyltransferase